MFSFRDFAISVLPTPVGPALFSISSFALPVLTRSKKRWPSPDNSNLRSKRIALLAKSLEAKLS